MHIEPDLVEAGKLWLSYVTAAGVGAYTVKLAAQAIGERGVFSLLARTVTATALVFSFFELLPHYPVGVSEVHLILGSTLFLLLGAAPAASGERIIASPLAKRIAEQKGVGGGKICSETSFGVTRITRDGDHLRIAAGSGCGRYVTVNELVVAAGFRPELDFLRELRLSFDPAVESTPVLRLLMASATR